MTATSILTFVGALDPRFRKIYLEKRFHFWQNEANLSVSPLASMPRPGRHDPLGVVLDPRFIGATHDRVSFQSMAPAPEESGLTSGTNLHFDVGSKKGAHTPFHLGLALPDAKSAGTDWHAQYRCRFVTAALLEAVGKSKLIDIKPSVERFDGNDDVHELKAAG
jgi:hypothetical protein